MFSALVCVAFAFSGFASNEVVKENEEIKIEENSNTLEKYVFSEEDGCTTCTVTTIRYGSDGRETSRSDQQARVCNNTCDELNSKLLDKQDSPTANQKILILVR